MFKYYRKVFDIFIKLSLCASLLFGGFVIGRYLYPEVIEVEVIVEVEVEPQGDQRDIEEAVGGAELPFFHDVAVDDVEFLFPVAESDFLRFTSPYGTRVSPILNIELVHLGIDIAATWRAEVVSVADGVVVEHWPPPGTPHPSGGVFRGHPIYGGAVLIEHDNGVRTLYAHLHSTRVNSTTQRYVRAGEPIGRIGNTGRSIRDHLHFEVIVNVTGETPYMVEDGDRVNPLLYIPDPRGD